MIDVNIILGNGSVGIKKTAIKYHGESVVRPAIHLSNLKTAGEIGRDVPDEEIEGTVITITFGNIESLSVLEDAVADCRKQLESTPEVPTQNEMDE